MIHFTAVLFQPNFTFVNRWRGFAPISTVRAPVFMQPLYCNSCHQYALWWCDEMKSRVIRESERARELAGPYGRGHLDVADAFDAPMLRTVLGQGCHRGRRRGPVHGWCADPVVGPLVGGGQWTGNATASTAGRWHGGRGRRGRRQMVVREVAMQLMETDRGVDSALAAAVRRRRGCRAVDAVFVGAAAVAGATASRSWLVPGTYPECFCEGSLWEERGELVLVSSCRGSFGFDIWVDEVRLRLR